MSTSADPQKMLQPPRWIQSILAGFNIIANNIHLVILPVVLDLFLWLGPHMRVKTLLEPYIMQMTAQVGESSAGALAFSEGMGELWQAMLTQFNLLSMLRTYPVGIPSLIANSAAVESPLGTPIIIELTSPLQVIGVWLAIILLGLFLGSLYYDLVARAAQVGETTASIWMNSLQTFLLAIVMILFLFVLAIPFSLFLSVITLINPTLGQIMLILGGVFVIWMLMPLIFSAHGIYVYRQNAMVSILTSVRMVRFLLPGVTMFILSSVLLVMGLDLIWSMPGETSWMQVIGIAGHAFITTAVLAASFVYYRNGVHFMQETLRNWANQKAKPA